MTIKAEQKESKVEVSQNENSKKKILKKTEKSSTIDTADNKVVKKSTKKTSNIKADVIKPVEEEVVEEEVVEEAVDEVTDEVTEDSPINSTKKRIIINKETIMNSFDEITKMIEDEIVNLRDNQTKSKGIKFLRSLNKKIKTLKTYSFRTIKTRNTSEKKISNNNSGFLKPVKISSEMAKFTGWNTNELKSRVDVTKFLCNYIKENNLQNPNDKRQIIADNKLCKLLDYDPKKIKDPLTYYRIQSYIKPHFIKT